jgi:hypothetical protein
VIVKALENHNVHIYIDNPEDAVRDIVGIKGVIYALPGNPVWVKVDPRYDVQEVADEIEALLTAEVPDVFDEVEIEVNIVNLKAQQ